MKLTVMQTFNSQFRSCSTAKMTLPANIQEIFFETLHGDKSLLEFEEWLYTEKMLESILSPEDYLELISFGYKDDTDKYDLYKLLVKLIDKGEYEKWKLLKLLHQALQKDKDLPQILMAFYDLCCQGYHFLDNLGMGYGLAVEVPLSQADSWDELTVEQQQKLLNSFYPRIEGEMRQIIRWLQMGKVVPTGIRNDFNYYSFIDNRTVEEKRSTEFYNQ